MNQTVKKGLVALFCVLIALIGLSQPSPAADASATQKEWTFLVFLNGFNNLDRFGLLDLNEMETVGSTDQVNVVVQWASYSTRDVKRVYVTQDNDPRNVTSPVVQDLGLVDMGDYRNLVDFVQWAKINYPAKHYFIDVWNHGSGWRRFMGSSSSDVIRPTDISFDDISGNAITTEQLGVAMNEIKTVLGQKVDLYGSDACLMSMVEVAGEMKDSVDVFLGSQHLEPADGWPYGDLLRRWNALAKPTARQLGHELVDVYRASYPRSREITLSALDMNRYAALTTSVRDLGRLLSTLPNGVREKAKTAFSRAQDFDNADYQDLHDLMNELEKATSDSELPRSALRAVKTSVESMVIANGTSTDMARAHGISIWVPTNESTYQQYSSRYSNLVFNRDTAWKDAIYNVIRR